MIEQTLVLIKPDGIARNLIGKIISRFEETGLKVSAMKMAWADEKMAKNHYFLDESWAKNVFDKAKTSAEKDGKKFPFKNHLEFGGLIQSRNVKFITEGPVIAMILEGPHSIEIVRKMIGATEPRSAIPGTIRGDFAMIESYAMADGKERVTRNLVHASESPDVAKREIALWFKKDEIHSYKKDLDKHF